MPRSYRKRGRRAKLTDKAKVEKKEQAAQKVKLTSAQAEAARQKRLEDTKAAIEALIQQQIALGKDSLPRDRPQTVIDYCRDNGLPVDIPFHPRYCAVGVPPEMGDQRLEAICFGRSWPSELGGLGGFGHLQNFIRMTWPDIEFNPWLEDCLRSLTEEENVIKIGQTRMRFVNWVGSGSSGKTFAAGLYACCWFMVDLAMGKEPRSSVTLTSTSKGIIAQRVWPVIQKCFHEAKLYPSGDKLKWGHMVDSQKMVLGLKGDDTKDAKHSICALAVESGELSKALDKIKGRHTERMLLVVDEANSTPQAIFECIPNMLTSARELTVLVIGNAGSRLDPHGQCCEPARGWRSITIEDTQWDTRGVAKWGIGPGVCIHFDAAKSPNVIAGRTEHKHIYSFERWQQVQRMGEEYKNTLQHWSQDRGFWPPDGISTTIFSEAMVISHDGCGKFFWLSSPKPCAALDPAFGGDGCWLQFGLLGDIPGNRKGLQLTEGMLVPFEPESPDPIDVQIARYCIKACRDRNVEPGLFGLDATGTGRGVAAFINHLWSNRIHSIEFGGAASSLPASIDDPRASNEVYANRVTELWYSMRDVLVADQLKGLYPEAIKQACSRTYEFMSRRYKVEPKGDMKIRLGYSPDQCDAISVLVDVCRKNGLTPHQRKSMQRMLEDESPSERALDALYDGSYSEPAAFSEYADVIY